MVDGRGFTVNPPSWILKARSSTDASWRTKKRPWHVSTSIQTSAPMRGVTVILTGAARPQRRNPGSGGATRHCPFRLRRGLDSLPSSEPEVVDTEQVFR